MTSKPGWTCTMLRKGERLPARDWLGDEDSARGQRGNVGLPV
jgi:hypothetical protein